ncbi:unnamed protein product [Lampetra planeri]
MALPASAAYIRGSSRHGALPLARTGSRGVQRRGGAQAATSRRGPAPPLVLMAPPFVVPVPRQNPCPAFLSAIDSFGSFSSLDGVRRRPPAFASESRLGTSPSLRDGHGGAHRRLHWA